MYINIGGGNVADAGSIIGIFDLDITSQSHITRNYLNKAERSGDIKNAADDIPRSYIVCSEKRDGRSETQNTIILCQPSPATLVKRAENESGSLTV